MGRVGTLGIMRLLKLVRLLRIAENYEFDDNFFVFGGLWYPQGYCKMG